MFACFVCVGHAAYVSTMCRWSAPVAVHVLQRTRVRVAAHDMNLHRWHIHQLLRVYMLACTILEHVYA